MGQPVLLVVYVCVLGLWVSFTKFNTICGVVYNVVLYLGVGFGEFSFEDLFTTNDTGLFFGVNDVRLRATRFGVGFVFYLGYFFYH